MRKSFTFILVIATALLFGSTAAAQVVAQKSAKDNKDGTYTLTLKSFSTGSEGVESTVTRQPINAVLVLDVSGSMSYSVGDSYTAQASKGYSFDGISNTTLYYKHSDGKYYQVYTDKKTSDSYQALASKGYTPNEINSGEYYYKHTNGRYYRLYRGGNSNNKRTVYYTVDRTTYYLHDTSVDKNSKTYAGGSIAYTGILYQKITYYRLYVTISSTKYYLSSDGLTDTAPTNVTTQNATIWTGILYKKSTDNTTRLAALKSACKTFVNLVADDATKNNVNHKISVVTFSSNASTKVTLANGNVKTNKQTVINAIEGLSASGDTYHGKGLDNANSQLNSTGADANATRLVILFTDGNPAPRGTDDFDNDIANDAITSAKSIKSDGKTLIYSINVFPDSDAQMHKYMNYISSNFPNATSMSYAGDGTESQPKDPYYIFASSASQLNSVFSEIANNTTSGGSDVDFDSTKTEVKDILSANFVLPEGADASSIKVYLADFIKPTAGTSVADHPVESYTFGTRYNAPNTISVAVPKETFVNSETNEVDTLQTIVVTGFDFKENWCGPITTKTTSGSSTTTTVDWHAGKELIFEFDIVPNPDAEGGEVYTNDERSGVYYKDKKTGELGNVAFQLPDKVYTPMDLKIVKNGLNTGESAIFKVTRSAGDVVDTGFEFTVIMTAGEENKTEDAVIAKVPVKNDSGVEYVYTVTETSWSWAYTNDTMSVSHTLYKDGVANNVFTFTNEAKTGSLPKHDEEHKNNKFD